MKITAIRILCLALTVLMLIPVCLLPVFAAESPVLTPNPKSPLKGIKVGFYGDSISAANIDGQDSYYTNLRGWAGRIGTTNFMRWDNHSVSGYSVSNCRGERTIMAQLEASINNDYDMIILHGGTNDAWDNAPVGIMTKDFKSYTQYSMDTFAGGLEREFAYIKEKNPDAIVGYIINFKFVNAAKGAMVGSQYRLNQMGDYVNMTINICKKWDIPYLDLYHDDALTDTLHCTKTDGNGNKTYESTYLYDYIHPSSLGYNLLSPYVESFMLDLIAPEEDQTTATTATATDAVTTLSETEAAPIKTIGAIETAEEEESGCGAALSCTAIGATVTALLGVAFLRKRKENIE